MFQWTPAEWAFAAVAAGMVAVGLYYLAKAITKVVAYEWFKAKERHTKRIIAMSKEDT